MDVRINNIEMDVSIQCRANIDTGVVNEYAEAMTDGAEFPPVVVFGTAKRSWIGDGWHRVLAARQVGYLVIPAELRDGGRREALEYALSANAANGLRRTNADKRRCVEIALKEYPTLSSRAIAELCGVSHMTVQRMKPGQVEQSSNSNTGRDGKQYPARRPATETTDTDAEPEPAAATPDTKHVPEPVMQSPPKRKPGPPCMGMQMARLAVMKLEEIQPNDMERNQAFNFVKEWINEQEQN